MAVIQCYPDELNYVNAIMHPLSQHGSFMKAFGGACVAADGENYEVLRPALHFLMNKYPADPERLRMERRDMGE